MDSNDDFGGGMDFGDDYQEAEDSGYDGLNPLEKSLKPGKNVKNEDFANSQIDTLKAAMDNREKYYAELRKVATDTEFWVALCFPSRAAKDEFLRNSKLAPLGDKYIDGMEAAEVLDVPVGKQAIKIPVAKKAYGDVKRIKG